jgi:hypothetical protein
MRSLSAFLALWVSVAVAAEAPDALETARRLAAAGAPHLALNQIERAQPREPAAPRWADWEALRLRQLARLGRHRDLLARVGALPQNVPGAQWREALAFAARAAVAAQEGAAARRHAGRLLWQFGPSADELRELRLLVIESHVADGKGEDAFRSMLRFDQDYRPLDRRTAGRFSEALVELDMAREAVNWVSSLDDNDPLKLLLRLKAGLTGAETAAAQARTLSAGKNDAGYWRVIAQAALQQGNRVAHVEALERVLDLADPGAMRLDVQSRSLWEAYSALAAEAATQHRLQAGDDAGWMDFAAKRAKADPALARALIAHLAVRGKAEDVRHGAQARLVDLLQPAGLELAALRVFHDGISDVATLHPQVRHVLGAIAERRKMPAIAWRFWEGLGAPADAATDEWQLRVASAGWRAGRGDAAIPAFARALATKRTLAPEVARGGAQLAKELLDSGKLDLADALFSALLPLADGAQRRPILFGLAQINEAAGQAPVAAEYYLRSALLAEDRVPDALALQARLLAARNLARAGYRQDARVQFEWLLKNSKDAAHIEMARRELGRP